MGTLDCGLRKILLKHGKKEYCATPEETPLLLENGFVYMGAKQRCMVCNHAEYIRFADFEIGERRAFYERKTASDFIASRKARLYRQLNLLDTFVEDNRKGLILEGMPRHKRFKDSKNFFSGYDKSLHDLRGLSPLEQAIEIGGRPEWCLSFIRECKSRNMEFTQTYDLDETITFLEQCDLGYDTEPKLRIIPKRYPDISIDQNMLCLIKGIGKATSESLLKEYGSLSKLITFIRKLKKSDAQENKILDELYKIFK